MSSELAIRARGLGKCYPIFSRPEDRLKQMLWRGRRRFYEEFWALRGVDLAVAPGEAVGIVGRNGSGKSTLLQLVCGTVAPSEGDLSVDGRVAALLELGAGFNPEFSGRENVNLSASIYGLSAAEIDERLDSIERFADIGPFLDRPVRSYSSGMYARLAFAVATSVDPDVLVVDEILSVGDEAFQRKCFARIEAMRNEGTAVLMVSHAAGTILELCDRAVLLDAGECLLDGPPRPVVSRYQRLLYAPPERAAALREEIRAESPAVARGGAEAPFRGAGGATEGAAADAAYLDPGLRPASTLVYDAFGARISRPVVLAAGGEPVNCLTPHQRYRFCYEVAFDTDCTDVRFHTLIKTVSGLEIGGGTHPPRGTPGFEARAGEAVRAVFEFSCHLNEGVYFVNCGVTGNGEKQLHRIVDALALRVLPVAHAPSFGHVSFEYRPALLEEIERS